MQKSKGWLREKGQWSVYKTYLTYSTYPMITNC